MSRSWKKQRNGRKKEKRIKRMNRVIDMKKWIETWKTHTCLVTTPYAYHIMINIIRIKCRIIDMTFKFSDVIIDFEISKSLKCIILHQSNSKELIYVFNDKCIICW